MCILIWQALDDFRDGRATYLLATDLAGRGLDIKGVRTVVNYELPAVREHASIPAPLAAW